MHIQYEFFSLLKDNNILNMDNFSYNNAYFYGVCQWYAIEKALKLVWGSEPLCSQKPRIARKNLFI